jgi:hypothetical protein
MKENNNSFESVDSNYFNEIKREDTKNNSANTSMTKEKNEINSIRDTKNTNTINANKMKIKKSIIFSNANTSTNNLIPDNTLHSTLKLNNNNNNNFISELNGEKNNENPIIDTIENYSKNKYHSPIIHFSSDKLKNPCIELSDKNSTKITLVKVIDQYYYEGHLKLKNKLKSEYLIFKIINDKPYYSITPTLYYIEPDKEITINLKRFEKLTINETKNVYDFLIVVVTHTKNTIEDVNDAKRYIRKEDLYSPEYQLYTYSIYLDYGYNPNVYKKEVEEGENIYNKYKNQLNMNNITDIEEVKKHIEEVKKEINEYENKINNLKSILGDINKKNIIKQEETIFDKETFYEVSKGKIYKELDDDDKNNDDNKIPMTLVILYFSICLFIGRFLKNLIWKK